MSSRQHLGAVHCELAWVRHKHHPHGRQSRIVMEFSPLTFQYPPTPPAHLISPPSIPSLNPCISATSRHADQNPSQNPSRKHCPRDGKQHRDDQQHETGRPDDIPDQTRPDEHRHRQKKPHRPQRVIATDKLIPRYETRIGDRNTGPYSLEQRQDPPPRRLIQPSFVIPHPMIPHRRLLPTSHQMNT